MLEKTLQQLEERIKSAGISDEEKANLAQLIQKLKAELQELSKTDKEKAQSIADFSNVTAQEKLRANRDANLEKLSEEGLKESIRHFEVSNPILTQTVDLIMRTLSRLGV